MEDQNIGKHCEYDNCNYQDYLAFTCDSCGKNLCKLHYHNAVNCPFVKVEANENKEYKKAEFVYIDCKFCKKKINKNTQPVAECEFCHDLFCWEHKLSISHNCEKDGKIGMKESMNKRKEKNEFQNRLKMLKNKAKEK